MIDQYESPDYLKKSKANAIKEIIRQKEERMMKKTSKRNWFIAGGSGVVIAAIFFIALFQLPANQFTMDVNPSLEITTNRLDKVIEVKALNEDAQEFLDGYEQGDNDLEAVINDLVDRMILTGHISGGQDNIVMISVEDDELNSAYLEKVNESIAAFLQNKQLEYRILNQGLSSEDMDEENQDDENEGLEKVSRGKRTLIQKLMEQNEDLTMEELEEISVGDLLKMADEMNISPKELFARSFDHHVNEDDEDNTGDNGEDTNDQDVVVSWDFALEKAFEETGGGMVVEFEFDREESEYKIEIMHEGYKYDIEMNAYSREILEMDWEEDDEADAYAAEQENLIGWTRAMEIAKDEIGGGREMAFEFDLDDKKYEIEIRHNSTDYEFEMNAMDGEILEMDPELDDDDRDASEDEDLIGRDEAVRIAKEKAGGGEVTEFEYDRDDGVYEIELMHEGYEYEFEIDAYTGEILVMEEEYDGDDDDDDDDDDDPSDQEGDVIGRDAAVRIAKEKAGGGEVTEFKYDMDDGVYEIELVHDGYEYEFEMNAYTGAVIEMEQDEMDDDDDDDYDDDDDDDEDGDEAGDSSDEERTVIGRDQAVANAIDEAGGGTIEEFDFDREEGKYEITVIFNGYEYEFEIDAYTGDILEMDSEELDDDEDEDDDDDEDDDHEDDDHEDDEDDDEDDEEDDEE